MLGTEPDVNIKHSSTVGSSFTLWSSHVGIPSFGSDWWFTSCSLITAVWMLPFCSILFAGIVQMPRSRSSEWPLTSSIERVHPGWRFCTRGERTSPRRSQETAHGRSAWAVAAGFSMLIFGYTHSQFKQALKHLQTVDDWPFSVHSWSYKLFLTAAVVKTGDDKDPVRVNGCKSGLNIYSWKMYIRTCGCAGWRNLCNHTPFWCWVSGGLFVSWNIHQTHQRKVWLPFLMTTARQ